MEREFLRKQRGWKVEIRRRLGAVKATSVLQNGTSDAVGVLCHEFLFHFEPPSSTDLFRGLVSSFRCLECSRMLAPLAPMGGTLLNVCQLWRIAIYSGSMILAESPRWTADRRVDSSAQTPSSFSNCEILFINTFALLIAIDLIPSFPKYFYYRGNLEFPNFNIRCSTTTHTATERVEIYQVAN